MSESLAVRVVFIGDSQVGKTSIINMFVRSSFEKQQKSTIGAVFHTYEQKVNGQPVVMQIWDTAGQEKYRSLGPIYYRNSAAGVCVFDMTSKETLPSLDKWISEFRKHAEDALIFVVGNKIDLPEESQQVTRAEVEEFAAAHDAVCFFTSAKTGENVKELFQNVFDSLVKEGKIKCQEQALPQQANGGSGGCC